MSESATGPVIAADLVCSTRELVREEGFWARVRDRLRSAPSSLAVLDELAPAGWVDVTHYRLLLEASAQEIGDERLRMLGRRRLQRERDAGVLSAILQSWLRSFERRPDQIVRVGPQLWRASVRRGGVMRIAAQGETFLRMRILDPPHALCESRPWQVMLEGLGAGLLELASLDGEVHASVGIDDTTTIDLLLLWG